MMTNDISSAYPEGEYLIGNFITDYVAGYEYFDRFIVKMFGDRAIEVDDDLTMSEIALEWTYDINAIVFTHLKEWAKMYSASIKDYEPLWNVDGTVETTYGETHREDKIAGRDASDIMGARHTDNIMGARHTDNIMGAKHNEDLNPLHTDTHKNYNTAYPDGNSLEVDKTTDEYGSFTTQHDERTYTDQVDERTYTDQVDERTYTDRHTALGYTDEFDADEHTDTERRTGNIGVTKSTELVESEYKLRTTWAFFKIIFSYILNEMGVHYYD